MEWFEKAFTWTMAIGFGMMGVYVALLVLRIAIGVAGFMLGSSIGTLLLAVILYNWWKKHKDEIKFKR